MLVPPVGALPVRCWGRGSERARTGAWRGFMRSMLVQPVRHRDSEVLCRRRASRRPHSRVSRLVVARGRWSLIRWRLRGSWIRSLRTGRQVRSSLNSCRDSCRVTISALSRLAASTRARLRRDRRRLLRTLIAVLAQRLRPVKTAASPTVLRMIRPTRMLRGRRRPMRAIGLRGCGRRHGRRRVVRAPRASPTTLRSWRRSST